MTKYSGTSRLAVPPLAVPPPVEIGTRKGSANTASGATSHGRRAMTAAAAMSTATTTAAPTTASSGWRWTMCSCGEFQMSVSSSTGARTSAPSIATRRGQPRGRQTSSTTAASAATTTTPALGKGPVRAAKAITKAESSTTLLAHALCEAGGGRCAGRSFAVSVRDLLQAGGRHAERDHQRPQGSRRPAQQAHRLPQAGPCARSISSSCTIAGKILPSFQVGTAPSGPTVSFEPTPGDAQGVQIQGEAQGAEVIGSALVYPNQASDNLLTVVEDCVAKGVSG